MPPSLYEEWRTMAYPADGIEVKTNPTALQWASEKHWNGKNVVYNVYLSQDSTFPEQQTITSKGQRFCFYNPHKKLSAGTWYWKYEIVEKGDVTQKGPYVFSVSADARIFETPLFAQILRSVPRTHPRVMNQGHDIKQIREKATSHPLYEEIIRTGRNALEEQIYDGPITDPDEAAAKALTKVTGNEIRRYHALLEAYVLSGEKAMLKALIDRTGVLLRWPTDDLLGSQVLSALSMGYDLLYDVLEQDVRDRMLAIIDRQLARGLGAWPGKIEGRQVENHFWQMELAGNFSAALATLHELENSSKMLEYTYELFVARFPNLATQEGGWAEGHGYFGVNRSAIVDMAVLMKKVGGANVFPMQWYENLPGYYIYFAPAGDQIAGFGDMHDRVSNGNLGQSIMLATAIENKDPRAAYRLGQTLSPGDYTSPNAGRRAIKKRDRWYQIVNDITFEPPKSLEESLPGSKVFYGVGLAAMHTDLFNPANNTAVYFRSSPFGAKGHMHANQNCFNISRKGERIFYSTGYYTTFADPHSLTSYRHTRAHNGILIDGCGQAFGHEGYGWIKRFIDGDELSYVCGDATMAYRPTVDKQFLELNSKNGIGNTPEYGFGDGELKLFERHLVFLKPGIVVIYDILESGKPRTWSWLLHSMKEPVLQTSGQLDLHTGKTDARCTVVGTVSLKHELTDKFYSPAIDYKKKYRATPDQYHINYTTTDKIGSMRYLAVLQLGDKGVQFPEIEQTATGEYRIGEYLIKAALDTSKPAFLEVRGQNSTIYVNTGPDGSPQQASILVEGKSEDKKSIECYDLFPF